MKTQVEETEARSIIHAFLQQICMEWVLWSLILSVHGFKYHLYRDGSHLVFQP